MHRLIAWLFFLSPIRVFILPVFAMPPPFHIVHHVHALRQNVSSLAGLANKLELLVQLLEMLVDVLLISFVRQVDPQIKDPVFVHFFEGLKKTFLN